MERNYDKNITSELVSDPKLIYLIRTLSRTKRKDYENYVINTIWNRLNIKDLQPVSQQYVCEESGKRYFIDLYFPQVRIGIECDEGYHKKQLDRDMAREEKLHAILNKIEKTDDIEILRVDVTKSFSEVDKEINEHVNRIRDRVEAEKKKGRYRPWQGKPKDAKEYIKGKNHISIEDDVPFKTIADASNIVFGTNYTGMQKAYFIPQTFKNNPKYQDYAAWFPKLELSGKAVSNGWRNELEEDGKLIKESNQLKTLNQKDEQREDILKKKRITFIKIRNPITREEYYSFAGVFEYSDTINDEKIPKNLYRRIDTEFAILRTKQ